MEYLRGTKWPLRASISGGQACTVCKMPGADVVSLLELVYRDRA